jgi:HAD superfamily hydrolase (TIGR01484 family)
MRARAREREGCANGNTASLRYAALIRPTGTFSQRGWEKGKMAESSAVTSDPQPLRLMPREALRGIKAVLSDIDDTLTLHGRLPASAFAALEKRRNEEIAVVPITGRPAGWCDHIARMWPVAGVVGENGAFYFCYDDKAKKMTRIYAQSPEDRRANRGRLEAIAKDIVARFPGTAIASDQAYREIDVAIDFREDVPPLPLETAEAIRRAFETAGALAKVSSIHINAWFGGHDKLTMTRRFLADVLDIDADRERDRIVYLGDSPNDSPMFAFFPNSVGVANVLAFRQIMPQMPHYVTTAEGGEGFAEFAHKLVGAKHGKDQ